MGESSGGLYKKEIIKMISGVDDSEFIVFLYRFLKRLKENWGA